MGEVRVNVDDLQVTAASCQASAGRLAGSQPAGAGQSFQPTTAAVQAVHTGAAATRAVLSARTATTGVKVAAVDARYVDNEADSVARLRAVDPQVV